VIRKFSGTLSHFHVTGSDVPGPPLQPNAGADGEAGLIEAASNDSGTFAWPKPGETRITQIVAKMNVLKIAPLYV